jgi:hypothetical protein
MAHSALVDGAELFLSGEKDWISFLWNESHQVDTPKLLHLPISQRHDTDPAINCTSQLKKRWRFTL